MLWTIIIILLVLAVIGGLPTWPYAAGYNYGYFPSGLLAVVLIVLVVLLLTGRL